MKKGLILGAALLSLGLLAACGKSETTKSDKLQVTTTFYPMYEFTKAVTGETADVSYIVPAGQEVHDYEPSAREMAKLVDSDVVVFNAENLETWFEDAEDNLNDSTLVIEASHDVDFIHTEDEDEAEHDDHDHEDHDHGDTDPHTWTSLQNAVIEVQTIADALSKKYPENKATYQANAKAYQEKLQALDQKFVAALEPATQKTFITQHAAFAYMARDYGLTQLSISGINPDVEPSSQALAHLKELMSQDNLTYVYFEENAGDKLAKTLAKEANAKTAVLNPIEGITTDEQKAGDSYLTIMEENLESLELSIK
jgi:zinc transport system substrate-binding protein